MKKSFSSQHKAAVALEAIRGEKSIAEISSLYEVHSTQIKHWRHILKEHAAQLFTDKRTNAGRAQERLIDELYRIIGKREMELAWLKKKLHLDLPGTAVSD